jgi:hypothetical protein
MLSEPVATTSPLPFEAAPGEAAEPEPKAAEEETETVH